VDFGPFTARSNTRYSLLYFGGFGFDPVSWAGDGASAKAARYGAWPTTNSSSSRCSPYSGDQATRRSPYRCPPCPSSWCSPSSGALPAPPPPGAPPPPMPKRPRSPPPCAPLLLLRRRRSGDQWLHLLRRPAPLAPAPPPPDAPLAPVTLMISFCNQQNCAQMTSALFRQLCESFFLDSVPGSNDLLQN
jgi:hypothetical protein